MAMKNSDMRVMAVIQPSDEKWLLPDEHTIMLDLEVPQ